MIKFQKIAKLLVMFLSLGILFSCSDDDTTAPFDVIGDVFVTKRMVDEETKFANSYYAYGNQAMTIAQVTTPGGTEIELNSINANGYTFGKTASSADFTFDVPEEGNYAFDVIHEAIQHQAVDLLVFNNLDFTVISLAAMENQMLVVEWEENPDAEVYMLRLMSQEGEVVFNSPTLPNQATRYEIDTNTGTGSWADGYPNNGDIYTLELHAFIFDEEAIEADYTFNIQEVSISEEEVTWN
jgi:hypothetical protein